MGIDLRHGDALEALRELAGDSIDAVVTDPPYGLAFMGKAWDRYTARDFEDWCAAWAAECHRVLKPGGYLLAFGGTRTVHRLTAGIEDAGFDIRDQITWLYGSGFPKSLDVGKAIDKAAGAEREVIGPRPSNRPNVVGKSSGSMGGGSYTERMVSAPASDAARQWDGWGTALKPASEPIVVARKPLAGTVAGNVIAHGTGALNIDGCRVAATDKTKFPTEYSKATGAAYAQDAYSKSWTSGEDRNPGGRWPANVVLTHAPAPDGGDACAEGCVDGCPVAELDAQSGISVSSDRQRRNEALVGDVYQAQTRRITKGHADTGGASRFFPTFRYQAKAPTRERVKVDGVAHPTVKPLALMRWLCRLVTPPGGMILDPFAGSGTTGEAAAAEGFHAVLIERETDYLPLIRARIRTARPSVSL